MTDILRLLREAAAKMEIEITEAQAKQVQLYYDMLTDWNQTMNLTSLEKPEEFVVKHFLDSLLPLQFVVLPQNAKIADIGTGAGFPGLPMKIVQPDLQLTLLDGLKKRVGFLEKLCEKLGIDAQFLHARAEDCGKDPDYREQFDVVTARAVAPMNILCEYCLPLLKMDGIFVALKGPAVYEELSVAENAVSVLGGEVQHLYKTTLPDGSNRVIVVLRKTKHTPEKYPRRAAKITRQPL